jgi:hypothetical protein
MLETKWNYCKIITWTLCILHLYSPLASSFACGVEKWRDSECRIGNGQEKRENIKQKMSNFSIHGGLKD